MGAGDVQEQDGLAPARVAHPVINVTPSLPTIPLVSSAFPLQALQANHLQVNVGVRRPQTVCATCHSAGVSVMVGMGERGAGGPAVRTRAVSSTCYCRQQTQARKDGCTERQDCVCS